MTVLLSEHNGVIQNAEIKFFQSIVAGYWFRSKLFCPFHNDDHAIEQAMIYLRDDPRHISLDLIKAQAFEFELVKLIDSLLIERSGDDFYNGVFINIDLSPHAILCKCCTKAGLQINEIAWPQQTTMWIDETSINIRCGQDDTKRLVWVICD